MLYKVLLQIGVRSAFDKQANFDIDQESFAGKSPCVLHQEVTSGLWLQVSSIYKCLVSVK